MEGNITQLKVKDKEIIPNNINLRQNERVDTKREEKNEKKNIY